MGGIGIICWIRCRLLICRDLGELLCWFCIARRRVDGWRFLGMCFEIGYYVLYTRAGFEALRT
jgi:hypothetical protein